MKWLGDIFHQEGLAASVKATIEDRKARVKGACYEAVAIIEDWRAQVVGGFQGALDLFEMAILPSLLYNAETWIGIRKETENELEDLQFFFLRLALRVPSGTPKVALRSETGMLSMKLRIWKKKLMFLHHISGLKEDVLAKKVWEQQKTRNWPGLVAEGQAIFKELGLDEEGMQECSKLEWRMKVGEAFAAKDEKFMLEEIRSKSKLEEI